MEVASPLQQVVDVVLEAGHTRVPVYDATIDRIVGIVHAKDLLRPLLPDAPDCLVVVVSQGPLTGIPDVRPCTMGGLDTAAAVELLASYAGPTRITVDPTTRRLKRLPAIPLK